MRLGFCLSVGLLLAACGDDHNDNNPFNRDGGVTDASPVDSRPVVDVMTSPEGPDGVVVTGPLADVVISDEQLAVSCHAEPDATSMAPVTEVTLEVITA